MISVIFPHAINPENDKVLNLCLKMISENTKCEHEVLYLANMKRFDLIYSGWDWMIRKAKYDLILWMNTDILLSCNWQENVLKHKDSGDWIGIELVEPGAIGVADTNIKKDFGLKADTFRRQEFEEWAANFIKHRLTMRNGFAWYCPSVFKKDWYIAMGGFDTTKSFPHPVDSEFKDKVTLSGCRFIVANSVAYHLQRGHIHQGLQPER